MRDAVPYLQPKGSEAIRSEGCLGRPVTDRMDCYQGRRKHLESGGGPSPKRGTLPRPFWASKGHFCIVC